MSAVAKYNNITISPTPYVSFSTEKIDYGNRWGIVKNYTLDGQLEIGSQSTNVLSDLTNIFKDNFKAFSVIDGAVTYINESVVHVDSINVSPNRFSNYGNSIGYIPYTVQLKSYDIATEVLDPSDEWAFQEGDDGTLDVTHKASARGIRSDSMNNTKSTVYLFVENLLPKVLGVRARPGQSCILPNYISPTANITNTANLNNMILMGESESFDRLTSTYSVSQNFKNPNTNVGGTPIYMKSSATLQKDIGQDYPAISLTLEVMGSESNLAAFKGKQIDYRATAASLVGVSTPSDLYQTSFKVSDDPNSNSMNISVEFLSGNATFAAINSGIFDYKIDMQEDSITHLRSYSINGEFICKGSYTHRMDKLNYFSNSIGSYDSYLFGLVSDYAVKLSSLFSTSNSFHNVNPSAKSVSSALNTGTATLSLSASFSDADFINGIHELKYNVGVELPLKIYKPIDSATVNGHHVLQELSNNSNSEKIDVSVDAVYSGISSTSLPGGNTIEEEIQFVFSRVEGLFGNTRSFQTSESSDKNNYKSLSSYSEKKSYTIMDQGLIGKSTLLNGNEVYIDSSAVSRSLLGKAKARLPGKQYGE